jgi:hypothetical protein
VAEIETVSWQDIEDAIAAAVVPAEIVVATASIEQGEMLLEAIARRLGAGGTAQRAGCLHLPGAVVRVVTDDDQIEQLRPTRVLIPQTLTNTRLEHRLRACLARHGGTHA